METLNLTYGAHESRDHGMCLMEAVAFLAGEGHSDQPECACPVISAVGRVLNDRMGRGEQGDALRAKHLAPLAEKLVGTRSTPEVEQKRAFFFADRAVRLFAPTALESAGLGSEAERLRGLPEIVDEKTAASAALAAAEASGWRGSRAAHAAGRAAGRAVDSADWAAAGRAAHAAANAAADRAANAAAAAANAAVHAEAWEQAAKVLAEACGITEGGA